MTKNNLQKSALLIGVSEYNHTELYRALPQVKNNIQELEKILSSPYLGGYTVTVHNQEPDDSAVEIQKSINNFLENNKNNRILIYYAGHGEKRLESNSLWLTAKNSEKSKVNGTFIDGTFIQSSTIMQYINDHKPKELVLILDCCFSGVFIQDFKNSIKANTKGKYAIVTACGDEERIYLEDKFDYSPFVHFFIKRINDRTRNSNITSVNINDLFNYVRKSLNGSLSPQKHEINLFESDESTWSSPMISSIKTKETEFRILIESVVNKNKEINKNAESILLFLNERSELVSEKTAHDLINVYKTDRQEEKNENEERQKRQVVKEQENKKHYKEFKKNASEIHELEEDRKKHVEMLCECAKIDVLAMEDLLVSKSITSVDQIRKSLFVLFVFGLYLVPLQGKLYLLTTPSDLNSVYCYCKLRSRETIKENSSSVSSILISPDSRNMIIHSVNEKVEMLNLDSKISRVFTEKDIKLAFYTPAGEIQVVSTDKNNVKIHRFSQIGKGDLTSEKPITIPLKKDASNYTFKADDKSLVAISMQTDPKGKLFQSIEIFSLTSIEKNSFSTQMQTIKEVIVKNDIVIIAGKNKGGENDLGTGSIEVFNWKKDKNQLIIKNNDHNREVTAMAISGNGNTLISSSAQGLKGGEIRVWDLNSSIKSETGKLISRDEGVQTTYAEITSIATNNAGDIMAISSIEDKIQIRMTAPKKSKNGNPQIIDSNSNQVNSLAFTLKGDILFSSDLAGNIVQYNLDKN